MSMKSASAPRRLYSTRGALALCFDGTLYGSPTSAFRKGVPAVVLEATPESITVKQRRPHAKAVVETWPAL